MSAMRGVVAAMCLVCAGGLVGCQTGGTVSAEAHERAREDRAHLARLVGAWDYSGWFQPEGDGRRESTGRAAGVIEHDHFVLFDTEAVVTQNGERRWMEGSMIYSVEPGAGLMLTEWSESDPSVHRMHGRFEEGGRRMVFDDFVGRSAGDDLTLTLWFETSDRWTATFRRDGDVAAVYTFTRAGR